MTRLSSCTRITKILFVMLTSIIPLLTHAQTFIDTSITIAAFDVQFDTDKADIRSNDSSLLRSLIDTSKKINRFSFLISAHTDEDGGNEYNQELSLRRSKAVSDFLIQRGIDSIKIHTSHHGEEQPKSTNQTEDGKQINRRATLALRKDIRLVPMHGIVIDDSSGLAIPDAEVLLRSKIYLDTIRSNHEGIFNIRMPVKMVVGLDVSAPGFLSKSEMFKVDPRMVRDTKEIRLSKLLPGKKISLNEFHFVGSKAILLPRSDPELKKLKQMMTVSDEVCIEIIGHVNFPNRPVVKQNTFEYHLSVARSKLIYEELVGHGISGSRMFYSGRGNWEMIYPKARGAREMQLNRRVEVLIQECSKTRTKENAVLDDRSYNFY